MQDQAHVLDVWYVNSGKENSSIPLCSNLPGGTGLAHCHSALVKEGNFDVNGILAVIDRVDCQSRISVPDYYRDAALNLSSDLVTQDTSGNLMFAAPVCACRGFDRGLSGPECRPQGLGYIFCIMFALIVLWLLTRVVVALCLLASGKLKTKRKQFLVLLAVAQHVGQLIWVTAWLSPYIVMYDTMVFRTYMANLGFSLAALFMFMFVCELVSQTSAFLRLDAQDKLCVTLRRIELVFAVLPFVVLLATWSLVFNQDTASRLGLLVFQFTVLVSVLAAFSFVVRVIDRKITRLLPIARKVGVVQASHSMLFRLWLRKPSANKPRVKQKRAGVAQKCSVRLDDTSEQLFATSRRLRSRASALRLYLVMYTLFGALYIVLDGTAYTPLKVLRVPHFCAWQLILSSIPTVGIGSLTIMKPATLRKSVLLIKSGSKRSSRNLVKRGIESSFVGTLTS